MSIAYRAVAAVALALGQVVMTSSPLSAGGLEAMDPLVFELTLSGDVDAEDSFGVAHECEGPDACQFVEDLSVFCTGDERERLDWGYPECAPGTFRVELGQRAGVTILYALVRFPAGVTDFDRHLAGSIAIPDGGGGTTIRFGWNYALTSTPTLPDTAAPAP